MKEIRSKQNEEIKAIAKLKMQKERTAQQKFLAEGFRVCKTLAQNILPEKIYCTKETYDKAKTTLPENIQKNPDIIKKIMVIASNPVMEKISTSSSPSGIVGVFSIPKKTSLNTLSSGIILVNIANPGNMGTLIRTCSAMGFKSVILINGTDPFSPKVVQASAGEIANVDIFDLSWQELKKIRKENRVKLIALVVSGGKNPRQVDFKNSLLVIGSEAHGIPQEFISYCNEKITLPMPGKAESLNAAVAGSIALYLASQDL